MNSPLIIVFTHDDYQSMFDMNLPLWEAHGAPILVVCPIGRSVSTTHPVKEFGELGSMGPQMVQRHIQAMRYGCLNYPQCNYLALFECDAICVTKELPLKKGLWGNTFRNIHNDWGMAQESWTTWQYLNFPWIIDYESAILLTEKADQYPEVIEQGYVDRWVAAIAQAAGIPMVRFHPRGFSRSKIEHGDPIEMDELDRVIRGGGTMFHGVKTRRDLDLILNLRAKYFPQ